MDSAVVPGKSGRNLGLWLGSGWGGGRGDGRAGGASERRLFGGTHKAW